MAEVADRLNLGYQTVFRMEHGDPQVSIAAYMSALWLFDLDRLVIDAAHPDRDSAGKALEMARLPKRVVAKRVIGADHDF